MWSVHGIGYLGCCNDFVVGKGSLGMACEPEGPENKDREEGRGAMVRREVRMIGWQVGVVSIDRSSGR